MASFFRSIGVKIFGIAVGLLALMIAASLVSAVLTSHVHRQLHQLGGFGGQVQTGRADVRGPPRSFLQGS